MKTIMKFSLLFFAGMMLMNLPQVLAQNVGINNATPAASALLDLTSTNKGLLVPRMTSAQRIAIVTPAEGLMVYETSTDQFFFFDGVVWKTLLGTTNGWSVTGNTGNLAPANFIGNIDSVDFIVRTKNIERLRVKGKGNVSLSVVNPLAQFDIFVNTTGDTIVYRGRNNSSLGTITQIGSIERLKDFSNTIDLNNSVNSAGVSINLNNNSTHDFQLAFDDAAKPGTSTWTVVSDERLKKDISPFKEGLETIGKINPVYYSYNGKASTPTDAYYVGVLAQELQKAAPYMVGSFEHTPNPREVNERETYLNVNNGALTYILVNAVKELDEKSKKLTHALKNISDFGVTEIVSGTEVAVLFDEEFSNALQGNTPPVVSVTPLNNAVHLCVKNVHRGGFTISSATQVQNLSVNWMAIAKINQKELQVSKEYSVAEQKQLLEKVKMKKSVIRTAEEDQETIRRNKEIGN
ncbi:MAG: tail fiber domain-containing protein [Bacteroidetes bacterium]|nr:tail fiber domain-containing protein [Bacteroidota bacterium]